MSSVVRPDSGLSVGLAELTQLSRTQFLSMLSSSVCDWSQAPVLCSLIGPLLQVSSHLARLEGGGDLGPAPATAGLLGLLRDVMAGAGHSVVEDTREDLDTIIATVCDPLTQTLETTAAKLPRLVGLFILGSRQ